MIQATETAPTRKMTAVKNLKMGKCVVTSPGISNKQQQNSRRVLEE
jgi:hypothetical protein